MAFKTRSIALMLLATLALACGGEGATAVGSQTSASGDDTATTSGAVSAAPTMTIEGRVFGPAPEVAAGESFTIINLDSTRHTFSSSDGSWEQVDLRARLAGLLHGPGRTCRRKVRLLLRHPFLDGWDPDGHLLISLPPAGPLLLDGW